MHISLEPGDKAITLDELGKFVQEAARMELPGTTRLFVTTLGFSGLLKTIATTDKLPK